MIKKERSFLPCDRYLYDLKLATPSKGFAQVDTKQDAWYYGTWANPFKFIIINYCEGDVTKTTCDNADEFRNEIIELKKWNDDNGYGCKIDPMLCHDIEEEFIKLGLGDILH